jgi:hypothetical protein
MFFLPMALARLLRPGSSCGAKAGLGGRSSIAHFAKESLFVVDQQKSGSDQVRAALHSPTFLNYCSGASAMQPHNRHA